MIGHLRQRLDPLAHPLQPREEVNSVLLIVVTSDRGLAGAFNSNLLKVAEARIREDYAGLGRRTSTCSPLAARATSTSATAATT